jgi:bacterioferritin-associated ferredoxin
MERQAIIDEALAKRSYSPRLRPRIERLLDGVEDRRQLHCCSSGCFVCTETLREILAEVEARLADRQPA